MKDFLLHLLCVGNKIQRNCDLKTNISHMLCRCTNISEASFFSLNSRERATLLKYFLSQLLSTLRVTYEKCVTKQPTPVKLVHHLQARFIESKLLRRHDHGQHRYWLFTVNNSKVSILINVTSQSVLKRLSHLCTGS